MLTIAFLCLLQAPVVPSAPIAPRAVSSANGRYLAVLAPRADEQAKGARIELTVHERSEGGDRRRLWSGILIEDRPDAASTSRLDLLSDDGAAFLRIDALPGEGPALRELLKGSNAATLSLAELQAPADMPQASVAPWIDLERGLRWRPSPSGLNAHWFLDLLGTDGLVRTLELDGGLLTVHTDPTAALDLLVRPPVPAPVFPATQETYVDSWRAPALAWAGVTVEIDGHGHDPSAGWRFIGFQVLGDPFETKKLVLVPRGVPPQGAAAQVLKPHLWTARFQGLPPGIFELEVCGREVSAGDPRRDPAQRRAEARTLELLSPRLVCALVRAPVASGAARPTGSVRSIALHADGRLVLGFEGRSTVELALLEDQERITARVLSLAEERVGWPVSAELAARGSLTWYTEEAPRRVALGTSLARLGGGVRALAEDLEALATRLDPALQPALYRIDAARSSVRVHTGSAEVRAAFGHDHELAARRFEGRFEVGLEDVFRSRAVLTIEADSFHVVDEARRDEGEEVEQHLRVHVLETARFPNIAFTGAALALRAGELERRGLDAQAGKLLDVVMTGELALHGITRTVKLPGQLALSGEQLSLRGSFGLKHSDYGMQPFSAREGTVDADDELRVDYELVAQRVQK